LDRAVANLQRAIDIVGDNAVLYAGLGYAYFQYVNIGVKQDEYTHSRHWTSIQNHLRPTSCSATCL